MITLLFGLLILISVLWYLPPVARWRDNRAQHRWDARHGPVAALRPSASVLPRVITEDVIDARGHHFSIAYIEPDGQTRETLIKLWSNHGHRVGVARLYWFPERVVLQHIDVDDAHRGQGLGTAMLLIIIRVATDRHMQAIDVQNALQARHSWYERHGFVDHPTRGMMSDLTGGSILYPRSSQIWTTEEDDYMQTWGLHSLLYYCLRIERHPDEVRQRLQDLGINVPPDRT